MQQMPENLYDYIKKDNLRKKLKKVVLDWMIDHNGCYTDEEDQKELLDDLMKCFEDEK